MDHIMSFLAANTQERTQDAAESYYEVVRGEDPVQLLLEFL